MTFPTIEEVTSTAFGTDATAHLVAMPTTVNVDDLLVCIFVNDEDATVTVPSGWSERFTAVNSTIVRHGCYVKKAAGTEGGATVDFVTSNVQTAAADVYRIRARTWRNSGTILNDIESGTAATGTGTTPDPPALNPTNWDVEDTLWLATYGLDNIWATTGNPTFPTNYTNGVATKSNATQPPNRCSLATCRRNNAAASEDPGTFTNSASQAWVAQTIAIRPSLTSFLLRPRMSRPWPPATSAW